MTEREAAALVAILVNAFPNVRFTRENADLYEKNLVDLDARIAHEAVEELIRTSVFLPQIAAIRSEVVRIRRTRATGMHERETDPRRLLGASAAPTAAQWGAKLSEMLESAAKYRRMAETWCAKLRIKAPADPGAEYLEIARAGAKGEDVRNRVLKDVLGVEEQEEIDRRYP
jgi:hypothetical protein